MEICAHRVHIAYSVVTPEIEGRAEYWAKSLPAIRLRSKTEREGDSKQKKEKRFVYFST